MTDATDLTALYQQQHDLYHSFTCSLSQLLSDLLAGAGISTIPNEFRTKTVSSFSEKISREDKVGKYNCLEDITDLSGIRLIAYLKEDCEKICEIIRKNFHIDEANSVNKIDEYGEDKFGYSSIHFVVSLNSDRTKLPEFARFQGLKAEIQVRTLLQHAWAAIDWRFRYKSEGETPRELRRRLYRISALLDAADDEFSTVSTSLQEIKRSYDERLKKKDLAIDVNYESLHSYVVNSSEVNFIVSKSLLAGFHNKMETSLSISRLFEVCNILDISTISDLDRRIRRSKMEAASIFKAYKSVYDAVLPYGKGVLTKCAAIRTALILSLDSEDEVNRVLAGISTLPQRASSLYILAFQQLHGVTETESS